MSAAGSPAGDAVELYDGFDGPALDPARWIPAYLPQWSSRQQAAARYELRDGCLVLQITEDQPPWCPDHDGEIRVSSVQTGVFAGPLGSRTGQHRFAPDLVVTEEQAPQRLYTPNAGHVEVRLRAVDDPDVMVAAWMIGYEDVPEHSGELCICEIFGRDVTPTSAAVGVGVHPFGDPRLVDDFRRPVLPIDAREPHSYAVRWGPDGATFLVDGGPVAEVARAPDYPMQLMLGIYELPGDGGVRRGPYPKELVVEHVLGSRA